MKHIRRIHLSLLSAFRAWIPLAVAITGIFIALYCTGQFILRSLANEEQVRISADVVRYLEGGGDPMALNSPMPTDIGTGLAPYIIFYSLDLRAMAGSGLLDNESPVLPRGVYEFTKKWGEHRLTWQPKPDVRHAVLMRHLDTPTAGYLLVGKSLKETERTICVLWSILSALWALTMLLSLLATAIIKKP